MKQDNVILDKSFIFAVRVVKLYKYLCDEKREYVLSKQLLRAGTSIGVNVNEAQAAQSKLSISSKEARESNYWINLLIKTKYLNNEDTHVKSLKEDIEEIIKLLTSIIIKYTRKINLKNNSEFKIKHSKLSYASIKDLGNKVFAFSKLNIDIDSFKLIGKLT